MSTSNLQNIPISSITMIRNYRDVDPITEKDADILELAESIKKHEVMQPVLLRPKKGKPNHYELIFGHRRLVASTVAKRETIPANIREIADADILEIQVTENLQRKDVHPMDEAVAFKSLQDGKKYSVDEIALRFGKKPDYITQRLKLNDLIPEAQKAFQTKGTTMLLGHAILIARVEPADQKQILKDRRDFGSVPNLAEYISKNIMRNLSSAAFNTKDEKLFPQAGPCTTCPKRTGGNPQLFADISSPDRCMDKTCFETKTNIAFSAKLQEIIDTQPNVIIVRDYYDKVKKDTNDLLQKMKVKLYQNFQDCNTNPNGGFKVKVKGFMVTGHNAGKIVDIYLKGADKAAKDSPATKENTTELIKGIQTRMARSKVLDSCKIHHNIIDAVKGRPELENKPYPWQPIDRAIMIFLLLDIAHLQEDDIKGLPSMPDGHGYKLEYFKKLEKLTDDQLALIIRITVATKYRNDNLQYGVSERDTPIKLIAEYLGIDTKKIQAEQDAIAEGREGRANKRIADLKKPVKPVATKKAAPKKKAQAAAVKKPKIAAPKKTPKKPAAKKSAKKK